MRVSSVEFLDAVGLFEKALSLEWLVRRPSRLLYSRRNCSGLAWVSALSRSRSTVFMTKADRRGICVFSESFSCVCSCPSSLRYCYIEEICSVSRQPPKGPPQSHWLDWIIIAQDGS